MVKLYTDPATGRTYGVDEATGATSWVDPTAVGHLRNPMSPRLHLHHLPVRPAESARSCSGSFSRFRCCSLSGSSWRGRGQRAAGQLREPDSRALQRCRVHRNRNRRRARRLALGGGRLPSRRYLWRVSAGQTSLTDGRRLGWIQGITGGSAGPPITSAVVRTTVPLAPLVDSHSTKAVKSASVIEYGSQRSHTW